ncbi:hypothetical protein [Pontibacter chitinilyticus]|uniref:hypothetical protein n=1 Tax=Pontibacter chitinilyticus TaxID=2674989 RepID=UPI00321BE635
MTKIDNIKRKKISQAINFVEELYWLLDAKKNVDLKEMPGLLRSLLDQDSPNILDNKYESANQNKNYLIGVLPNLFQDLDLFKTNLDLSDFAEHVLKISVTRAEKRSKYELIGLIICEVTRLNDSDLTNLVSALYKITGSKEKFKQFKEAKKSANFSWNEAIQELSKL